ncbi:MAG: DUF2341 domain-containing protein [Fibrobacterota bacterium]|nr:DUF2341 domain-containing protein [Fibrobacterota bacterium]
MTTAEFLSAARSLASGTRKNAIAWAGAALLLACGSERLASSEIGNPPKRGLVMGIIYRDDGRPAPGTRVGLLPSHFDPVRDRGSRIWFDTTDAQGAFAIDSVDSGSYNIQAINLSARTSLLIQGVEVRSGTTVASTRQFLQNPGAVTILIPDSVPTKNGYVYLPGTDVYSTTESLVGESRLMMLDSIPAGMSPEIIYRSASTDSGVPSVRIRLAEGVTIVPGDTVPASAFQAWTHSTRLFLNTGVTGANIDSEAVYDFPMVVRLGPGASVFSTAAADGRDIRFTKPNGMPLSHEIESWDKSGSEAIIWVRMDTVLARDSTQFIRMYWGNTSIMETPAATKPVFDTAAGFQGVWHMEAMQAADPPVIKDASATGNQLSAGGGQGPMDLVPTPLGRGLELDGDSSTLFTSKSLASPNVFTISLWFKTTTDLSGKLIGFGLDPLMADVARDRHIWMDTTGKVHFGIYPNPVIKPPLPQHILSGPKALNDGKWHMVAGMLSGGGQVFYVDGTKVGEDPSVTTAQTYSQPRGYWKIGFDFEFYDWPHAPKALYFKGTVDEARVSQKSFSKEWIKLSYESQRPDSRFLRFDKR